MVVAAVVAAAVPVPVSPSVVTVPPTAVPVVAIAVTPVSAIIAYAACLALPGSKGAISKGLDTPAADARRETVEEPRKDCLSAR